MMKKFVKQGVIALVLTAALPAYQAFAQDTAPQNPKITAIYKALTESKNPAKTIAELARAHVADAETIASVAAAAGISIDTVEAGMKLADANASNAEIVASYNKGLNDIAAYTPATAAGANTTQLAQAGNSSNGGFASGTTSSLSGGGGGSASHN